jgi:hypothetical protein
LANPVVHAVVDRLDRGVVAGGLDQVVGPSTGSGQATSKALVSQMVSITKDAYERASALEKSLNQRWSNNLLFGYYGFSKLSQLRPLRM